VRSALLLLLAVAAFAAPSALAGERHPTLAELETEVVCPTCHTTLDQSDSPIARRMKQFILARIRAGDTKSEIKQKLVDEFGVAVLAEPPKKGFHLLAWLLPLLGLVVGAAVVGVLAWRWSRSRAPTGLVAAPAAPLPPDVERRLDEELRRFDA
jgi:cytochrome c-type biogenesis protein CcmH